MAEWTVHKFGGSSLADASRYEHVGQILADRSEAHKAVVVSAMAGVTDRLLAMVELAGGQDPAYGERLDALQRDQHALVDRLVDGERAARLASQLDRDIDDIADVLRAVWLLGTAPKTAVELVSGYGELWSAQILAGHLDARGHAVTWLDARQILRIEHGELGPVVDWDHSRQALDDWEADVDADYLIITGFIAADADQTPTTLGRNGSDLSASIFGSLLEAEAIHIWTDVDGVMSANPAQVPDAEVLERLSYQEAMELAYFGAKVIHPATMAPAVDGDIPVYIRNTFNPDFGGTRIHHRGDSPAAVKGFATVDDMALVNIEGTGMIGVPGISHRLFGALREAGVSVVMISQASSEHSICFAVPQAQADQVDQAVRRGFFAELHQGQIHTVDITRACSILAVVGDGMAGLAGVAATFFGALGKAGVNIRAIAQGSSERNISVVIDQSQATRALRAAHSGFYLSNQTLSVGLIGPGNVGASLLDQLAGQVGRLRDERMIDIRVRGITGARQMLVDDGQIELGRWRQALDDAGQPADMHAFVDHIQTDYHPHALLIDCTASQAVADKYSDWLADGIHVITPNKKANTASMDAYRRLKSAGQAVGRHYLYETTVGAGLPVVQTLRDLIETGDKVRAIEGVLSGTLAYLFNTFSADRPFSEVVAEARRLGYTEPDPRQDLSGMDVARKMVILGREMGLELELDDVAIDSLVPVDLQGGAVDAFMAGLADYDADMADRLDQARRQQKVLRFVGSIDADGHATVGLRRYDQDHPFGRIERTDNIVQFRTHRYDDNPLIVQGPGAGPEVTAGGIFADILRLSAYVGATP